MSAQSFATPSPVQTVEIPQVGQQVRVWLHPFADDINAIRPMIVDGTVVDVGTFAYDGSLWFVEVVTRQGNQEVHWSRIGSIEIL